MQSVLFSWLVVGELRASPEWVGACQTSTMLPALALLLVGGATADRRDPRTLLIVLHALAAVPVIALGVAAHTGALAIPVLLLYGGAIGTIAAFTMPARDTLLSRVAGDDMMRAVTGMTATQFGAQATGTLLASAARWFGSPVMLLVQAIVLVAGSFSAARVPAGSPILRDAPVSAVREIGEGLAEVARTPRLRSAVALVFAVGALFVGPFIVLFPLLVRDHYGGGVEELSLTLMCFPLGTIAGSLLLRAIGGVERKGRATLVALAVGASILFVVSRGLPFFGMVAATLVWGLSGSVFINCNRTLYQEAAPRMHRARVLSVYQLGFMGAAPVGSLLAGFVAGRIGPLDTMAGFATAMLVVVAASWAFSDTARMD